MSEQSTHWIQAIGLAVVVLLGFTLGGVGTVGAATSTSVSVTPSESTAEVGETVTVNVSVDELDNGVASYSFSAALDNPEIAEITDVSLEGTSNSDAFTTVDIGENGSTVDVSAGSASHTNGTIASITLQTTSIGQANLSLSDVAVGDAGSNNYNINGANGAAITVTGPETSIDTQPSERTVPEGETGIIDIAVSNTEDGVASYSFNASVENPDIATIENVDVVGTNNSATLTDVSISDDGSSVSVVAGAANHTNGVIASIQLRGHTIDSTNLSITDVSVGTSEANDYTITDTESGVITVRAPPSNVVNENKPTDTDGDGTYEDVNGNGELDIVDVNALFKNRGSEAIIENHPYYDFNGNGEFDIVDINKLFELATSS